jgi:hypothetical protein
MSNRPRPASTRRSIRARALTKRKTSFHPTLEGLESRLVLSTITWSGAGDGTTFSSGANWNGGVAPGSGDDAQIAISGFNDIQLPAGGVTLHSLSVTTSDTLDLSAGTLTTTTGLSLSGGAILNVSGGSIAGSSSLSSSTLNFSGGSISATLINSTLNYLNLISSTDSFLMLSSDTLTGPISSTQTLTVQGNNTNQSADLVLLAGSSNMGTIVVQCAIGNYYASQLTVASDTTFVNTGTIEVGASIDNSVINGGNFDNQGTFTVASGATLVFYAAGSTFTQDTGGTFTATGTFLCSAGTLLVNGGTVSGNVDANGCYLELASTISVPTTIYAVGGNNTTLISNASPFGTVWVEGSDTYYDETLALAPGAINVGTILLQSASGAPYNSDLTVAMGTTFVNTGTIEVGVSSISSEITTGGNFDNQGTITVASSATLNFDAPGSTFTQDTGGTINATGNFNSSAGTLLDNGGTVSGDVTASGGYLELASTITAPTTIYVPGAGTPTTLVGNDSPLGTVWVRADGNGDANLSLEAGATNVGTILLQPETSTPYYSDLSVANGTTFINTGTVEVGSTDTFGELTGGNFDNQGIVKVDAGGVFQFQAPGSTFTQDTGGTLSAAGGFYSQQGTLLVNGGTVSGNVFGSGGDLQLASTITEPTTIYVSSNAIPTTLLDNASTLGTVWVEGTDTNYGSTMIVAPGATNAGTILLQSASGAPYASDLTITSGSTFVNSGTVEVGASSKASLLTGDFNNAGVLDINGASLTLANSGTALVNETTGLINAWGTLTDPNSSFTNNGTLSIETGAAASLAISGTYTQSSTGSLNVELGGTSAGTTYDQLAVSGSASLAGTLAVSIINGFSTSRGNTFSVLTSASNTGSFSTYNGLSLGNGVILRPSQSATTVTLTASAPSILNATTGTPQSAVVGTSFTTALQATVEDQSGNLLAGVVVTFAAPGTGASGTFAGNLTSVTATTNSLGVATAPAFTAGTTVGSYLVTASVSGISTPASYSLKNTVGAVTSITATAGSPQSATVGIAFATALQATVDDPYGNPISGLTVTFAAPSSGVGGSFTGNKTSVTATTNALGVATAPTFTANTTIGSYTVTASVSGVSTPASYSLTNTVGAAASITASAGTPQSTVVGTPFATAFQAIVDDQNGNPISGLTITFAAPASGSSGNFSGSRTITETTNAMGVATAPSFTAGTTVGSYSVTASVSGVSLPASYSLTDSVGTVTSVSATAGTPQSAFLGVAFATALQATVDDQYGNPISGVVVTFAAPSSGVGGSFAGNTTSVTATTNALGVATAPAFTANTTIGSYTVTASVSGVSTPVSYSLTNTVGAATSITASAGTPQSTLVATPFATAFQAIVDDQNGNPIPGLTVTFAAPASGASGSFSGAQTITETTNAMGVASAPAFTASKIAGNYAVTATVSGVSTPASFSLTNTAGAASSITATAGASQTQLANVVFATAFQVTIDDQYGNPVSGVSVNFAAPAIGTSGNFAGFKTATATTNALGVATAPAFTAGKIAGSYSVMATANGLSSTASFSLTNTEMTSTTLNVASSLVPIDVAETLTATVAPVAPGLTTPTGSVSFYDGSKLLGSATINSSGQAVLTTSTLAYGSHSFTASYTGIPAESTSASKSVPVQVGDTVTGDYDGDGKSDIAIFDQTTATFYIEYSGGGTRVQQLGNSADKNIPVAGDFDGDGKDDLAIYDQTQAIFYILYSKGGSLALPFGNKSHVNIPLAGDYDGGGKTDIAIFDQTASIFYILYSNGGSLAQAYGNPAHVNIPVAGDFDGSGKTNIAIYDQTAAIFYVQKSNGGTIIQPLGNASHVNVPIDADYDGDGKTDFAVYDQTAGILYALESGGGTIAQPFGNPANGITPLVGDFTGDGKTDIGIYDATNAEFFILYSDGGSMAMPFGNNKHKNIPV